MTCRPSAGPSYRSTLAAKPSALSKPRRPRGAVCAADCEEPQFAGPLDPSWFLAAGPGQQTPARPPRIASSACIRVWMVQRLSHPNLGSWPTRYVSSLGPQAGQSRDQLRRRAAQDSCSLAAGEFRTGLDVGATRNGEIAAQVGVVRAEHDPVDSHDVSQHVQHRVAQGQGRVPVQAAEYLGRGRAALGYEDDAHTIDDAEPPGQVRHGASGVGEYVLDVRGAG